MGQEQSGLVDDNVPPQTLSERSLAAVADLIKDGHARRIVVLTGAGISTAAGIPDFRSPETGLYANLQRLNLPFAEAVFDIGYFREHPEPFYALAQELYPGKYHPTVAHVFIRLLARKGLLLKLFTQNIDCLERAAGVPGDLVVEAHGSFATQHCINKECSIEFPENLMKEHVTRGEVPRCKKCHELVKPDITFFGESLPARFFQQGPLIQTADLVLILGTSLSVHPFASLPEKIPEGVPRVLFNLEQVGGIGMKADDVLVLDNCDSGVRQLADELGWREELELEWRTIVGDVEADRQLADAAKRGEVTRNEVDRLADEVDKVLHVDGIADDMDDDYSLFSHQHLSSGSDDDNSAYLQQMGLEKLALEALSHGMASTSLDDEQSSGKPSLDYEGPKSESDLKRKPSFESKSGQPEKSRMLDEWPLLKDKMFTDNGSSANGTLGSINNASENSESKKPENELQFESEKKRPESTAEVDSSLGDLKDSGLGIPKMDTTNRTSDTAAHNHECLEAEGDPEVEEKKELVSDEGVNTKEGSQG